VTQLLTIPSRKLEIWRRMYDRFQLEPMPASVSPDVAKTIQPITSVDELLRDEGILSNDNTYTAGQAVQLTMYTVPPNQRWSIWGFNVDSQLTGDNLSDQINVESKTLDTQVAHQFTIENYTGVAQHEFLMPGKSVRLNAGDTVRTRLDGTGVAAGSVRMQLLVDIEVID